MLTLTNVSAGYGEGDVVKDISLSVKPGESLAIIGPNGCGKTTLLKAIAGLLPYKGAIELDGQPVSAMKREELSLRVAMLGQTSELTFSYSVFDTVMMGRYPHIKSRKNAFLGSPSREDFDCVTHCLSVADLLSVREREITRLSGGQLQRVFLARALAQQPDIILLDEPTNHLDLRYQIELMEYLRDWSRESGISVVGALHDVTLAMRLGGDILVMRAGKSAACGKAGEAVTGALLKDVYGVDVVKYMQESFQTWVLL